MDNGSSSGSRWWRINQVDSHGFNTVQDVLITMTDRKKKAKLIILLGVIWFVITLPLPWIINNPDVSSEQFNIIMGIIGIMSIPFVVLGIVWTLKPELTT